MIKNKMIIMLFLFAFIFAACERKTEEGTLNDTTGTTMDGTTDRGVLGMNEDFVLKAASGGLMEVELGKLAQQKGFTSDVKNFGKMMVTDHTKANNQLKQVAQQLNITLPDSMMEDHRDNVEDLRELSGKEFDEKYIDLMVEDHEEDVSLFEDAAENDERQEVKNFARNTVPVLKQHHERARQIQEKLENRDK